MISEYTAPINLVSSNSIFIPINTILITLPIPINTLITHYQFHIISTLATLLLFDNLFQVHYPVNEF